MLLLCNRAAIAQDRKPNILVIWGDDIGVLNISAYNHGMMGYKTPNIDRIAKEGAIFTDCYGQQSCTAGRAAFITGQIADPHRPDQGRPPRRPDGLQPEDPTHRRAAQAPGLPSGQFGKNHLGDRNEFLPTVHGFDEFFGNLYHLNAEEEPENPDYPQGSRRSSEVRPARRPALLGEDTDDPTTEPRLGRGQAEIEDTGPLTKKRMETMDEELSPAALEFIERGQQANKPFFCWVGTRPACISGPT